MPRSLLKAATVMTMLATPITAAADAALDAALYGIGRAETQSANLNPAKAKRITMMIENAEASLARSKALGTNAFADAQARLEALKSTMLGANTAPAATTTPVTPTATTTHSSAPAWDPMAEQAKAELASLGRRTTSALQQIQQMQAGDWMQPHRVSNWDAQIAQLEQMAANTAHVTGQKADAIRGQVAFLRRYFQAAQQVAAQQSGDAEADWQAYRQLESWAHQSHTPQAPNTPDPASVTKWLDDIAAYRAAAQSHRARVAKMTDTHPNLAQSMIDTLALRLDAGVEQSIARQGEILVGNLKAAFSGVDWLMTRIANADPEDQGTRWNLLTGQKADWARRDLETAAAAVGMLAKVQMTLGLAVTDHSEEAAAIANAIATFEAKQMATIAHVRFPETRVEKIAYLQSALTALGETETGEILRAAITSEVTKHNRSEGRADFGAVVIEITISDYVWEEFQVTTAEKTPEGIRLFINTFRFFHQGGSDVPVGKWVLGARLPSTPILPEHVQS